MTQRRTRTCTSTSEFADVVDTYVREGYDLVEEGQTHAVVEDYDRGGLLSHLALFFTVGWLTFGLLNAYYAHRRKVKSHDRVEIQHTT